MTVLQAFKALQENKPGAGLHIFMVDSCNYIRTIFRLSSFERSGYAQCLLILFLVGDKNDKAD